MTALAKALHVAVKDARHSVWREPAGGVARPAKARQQMLETPKVLEKSCGWLAARVEGGGGRQETLNTARKIRSLVRDAEILSRKSMSTQQTDEGVGPAEQAFGGLVPYHFVEAQAPPQEPAESS